MHCFIPPQAPPDVQQLVLGGSALQTPRLLTQRSSGNLYTEAQPHLPPKGVPWEGLGFGNWGICLSESRSRV